MKSESLALKGYRPICLGCLMTVAFLPLAVWAGNVCTWKGGSGKFSDANWDVAPVSGNGDTIVIDSTLNDNAPIVLENDLCDDLNLKAIHFTSGATPPGKVTLNGRRIHLTSQTEVSKGNPVLKHGDSDSVRGPELEVNLPLRLTGGSVQLTANATFNGTITIDGTGNVRFAWPFNLTIEPFPVVTVNGAVIGPDASFDNCLGNGGRGSSLHFYGHLQLNTLYTARNDNGRTITCLHASGNEIGTLWFQYGYVRLYAANALGAATVVQHGNDQWGPGVLYLFSSTEQTVNVFESADNRSNSKKTDIYAYSTYTPTMVMKASRDATFDGRFTGGQSLVYDPQGDYTYTLAGGTNSMTGALTVRGGTLALAAEAVFSAARVITVESGATLDVSASTEATPIAASVPVALCKGGRLAVPEGKTLVLGSLSHAGVPLAARTYSGETWLTGGGSVTVTQGVPTGQAFWARPANGNWNVTENWIPGVPTAADSVHIVAEGDEPYAVTLDAGDYTFPKFSLGTGVDQTATLRPSDGKTFFEKTAFNVLKGGVWEQTAGLVTISNSPSWHYIEDGGVWRISGGTNIVFANNAGNVAGFLSPRTGGEIQVTGGKLDLRQTASWVSPMILSGGAVKVSGTGELDLRNPTNPNANGQLDFGHGTLEVSGNGVIRGIAIGNGSSNGRLSVVLRDNALFDFLNNLISGYQKGADVLFDFGSANASGYIRAHALFGANYRSRCEVRVRAGARAPYVWGHCVIGGFMTVAGFKYPATASEFMPTGVVEVAGQMGVHSSWGTSSSDLEGVCIGSAIGQLSGPAYGRTTTWPVGSLTVTPTGVFTNEFGALLLGTGYGEGTVMVRGGRFVKSDDGVVVLGGGAGQARLTVTEVGTFMSTTAPVHIGGFNPADYNRTWSKYPIDDLSSTSRVDVVDGTLDFSNVGVTAGAYGTAFLSVGTNGLVQAKNLALNARVETELAFTVGAGSCGRVAVSDTLTIANGARLAIAVQRPLKRAATLIEAGTWSGAFAEADVTVTVSAGDRTPYRVVRSGTALRIVPSTGTLLLVR